VEGAVVMALNNGNPSYSYSAVTDAGGAYALSGIMPGTYTFRASKAGYGPDEVDNLVIPSKNPVELHLELDLISGCLRGTVTNVTHSAVSNADVAIVGTSFATKSLTGGSYALFNVPSGTYTVLGSKPADGYADKITDNVDISTCPTLLDIVLLRNLGDCTDDCTKDGICSSDCNDRGNCHFYDETAMNVCDGQRAGFVKQYSATKEIVCCSGEPYSKVSMSANFQVDAKHVARVLKPVQLPDGRLGKLIVYTFR
jgi:hypothetical protein